MVFKKRKEKDIVSSSGRKSSQFFYFAFLNINVSVCMFFWEGNSMLFIHMNNFNKEGK